MAESVDPQYANIESTGIGTYYFDTDRVTKEKVQNITFKITEYKKLEQVNDTFSIDLDKVTSELCIVLYLQHFILPKFLKQENAKPMCRFYFPSHALCLLFSRNCNWYRLTFFLSVIPSSENVSFKVLPSHNVSTQYLIQKYFGNLSFDT